MPRASPTIRASVERGQRLLLEEQVIRKKKTSILCTVDKNGHLNLAVWEEPHYKHNLKMSPELADSILSMFYNTVAELAMYVHFCSIL